MSLYLVGTPIGNLEDMSARALRILREVSLIAAEDTRVTGKLLRHFEIRTPMVSYHDFSGERKIDSLVARIVVEDVALVSDAGMPGLADPGYRLVQGAVNAGIPIIPIPAGSAVITALVCSGLPTDSFLFRGFLPRQSTARQTALQKIVDLPYTLIFYESPHRLVGCLRDLQAVFGDRQICVGRELTKIYEEFWRGNLSNGISYFTQSPVRGEVTIVVAGASSNQRKWEEGKVREQLQILLSAGIPRKEAARQLAQQSGWRKREIYKIP